MDCVRPENHHTYPTDIQIEPPTYPPPPPPPPPDPPPPAGDHHPSPRPWPTLPPLKLGKPVDVPPGDWVGARMLVRLTWHPDDSHPDDRVLDVVATARYTDGNNVHHVVPLAGKFEVYWHENTHMKRVDPNRDQYELTSTASDGDFVALAIRWRHRSWGSGQDFVPKGDIKLTLTLRRADTVVALADVSRDYLRPVELLSEKPEA